MEKGGKQFSPGLKYHCAQVQRMKCNATEDIVKGRRCGAILLISLFQNPDDRVVPNFAVAERTGRTPR